jgi:hypothetical protein
VALKKGPRNFQKGAIEILNSLVQIRVIAEVYAGGEEKSPYAVYIFPLEFFAIQHLPIIHPANPHHPNRAHPHPVTPPPRIDACSMTISIL